MGRKKSQADAYRSIAIEGPIGVGKTTLARALSKRLSARAVEEDIDGNPFIQQFYGDPTRTAFQTQMFFLLSRYQQQLQLKQGDLFAHTTVADYMFQKDRIFAHLTLGEAELALYERIYRLLDPRIPQPDLVVYLQARPDVLMDRIRSRSRSWERAITLDYLQRVARSYSEYFFHYPGTSLLVINTNDIDIVEKESHLDDVISAIRRMKKGVQHYNPLASKR